MSSFTLPVSTRRLLALVLLVVVGGVVLARHLGGGGAGPPLRVVPVRVGGQARAPTVALLVVDVEGAVRRPGLVRLPKGARVADAVARAGGLTAKAERTGVDLAALVADGQQVLVPTGGALGAAASNAATTGPISLNSATAEQLDTLPGIGPVTTA
jgi:competence protein ComEA